LGDLPEDLLEPLQGQTLSGLTIASGLLIGWLLILEAA